MADITSSYSLDEQAAVDKARGTTAAADYQKSVTLKAAGYVPSPTTIRRGTRMGISAGPTASTAVLDGVVELGLGWVRVSHEFGWMGTVAALKATCDAAHARGLKVIQCVQKSGKRYDGGSADITNLTQFTLDCIAAGADAVEIGNEWQHQPFWQAPAYNLMPPNRQAEISTGIAKAVRAKYPNFPLITNGMSPEANQQNPYLWWPQFWDCRTADMAASKWTGIGVHPYCYPELATTNPIQWNPMAQVPSISSAGKQRGLTGEVWLTEFGAPGFATNAPVVRNIALTESRQNDCFNAYFTMIKQHETAGIKVRGMCIATLFDGQSVTTSVEQGLGLIRKDGTKKPVWTTVKNFANELVAI